jgi:hypothetical protein
MGSSTGLWILGGAYGVRMLPDAAKQSTATTVSFVVSAARGS